jgi:3-hydroxybutyryl-CoA dehydrogenase
MHIVVIADADTQKEVQDKQIRQGVQVYFVSAIEDANHQTDAFFYLADEEHLEKDLAKIKKLPAPVFVNAVATTLKSLPSNCIRINAWPGFLLNRTLEVSATQANVEIGEKILKGLGWQHFTVPDIVGFIAPRTIAMIINEAYFALGEQVSTRDEIDTAMKLGTNYPYGPFQWSVKIGLKKIYNLLIQLSQTDKRYIPAPLLEKEIKQKLGTNSKY